MNNRLQFLDFIRGIAALTVFLEHAGDHLVPGFRQFTHSSFSIGKFGVVIFFLTSGFVIPMTLDRGPLVRFWVNRFFRLYPLYWISLILALLVYYAGAREVLEPAFTRAIPFNAAVNLTMVQELLGVPHALGLYYTLTLELLFYVGMTILAALRLTHHSVTMTRITCGLMFVLCVCVPFYRGDRVPMAGLFYILTLFMGSVFYQHYTGRSPGRQLLQLMVFAVLLILIGAQINYSVYRKNDPTETFSYFAVVAPWLLGYLIFTLAYRFRTTTFASVFLWLGQISYSVYLLHPLIVFSLPSGLLSWSAMAVAVVLTLAVSAVTFLAVEQPFIRLGRRFYSRYWEHAPRPPQFESDNTVALETSRSSS